MGGLRDHFRDDRAAAVGLSIAFSRNRHCILRPWSPSLRPADGLGTATFPIRIHSFRVVNLADAARNPRLIQLSGFSHPTFSAFKSEKTKSAMGIPRAEAQTRALGGTRRRVGASPGFLRPGRPKPSRNFLSHGSLSSLGRSRPSPCHLAPANRKTLVPGSLPGLVAVVVPDLIPATGAGHGMVGDP
jgi:hypothetical protein